MWPETINWTMHILNRSPNLAVKNKTPEEAWSGCKPSVAHLRVFGCLYHVHVPDAKRTKQEEKSKKCIFLGMSDESNGYRLYAPIEKKVIVSRDVVFEENNDWNWNESHKEEVTINREWGESDNLFDDEDGEEEEIGPKENVDSEVADAATGNGQNS